jgi:hypothetical protein
MKPTSTCKHAQFEREHKWHYQEHELADGCWVCGGPLTLSQRTPYKDLKYVGMESSLREELEHDAMKAQRMLDWLNRPEWVCKPCERKRIEGFKKHKPEDYIDAKDLIEEMRGRKGREKYIRETLERIAEVEACLPDCPYRERLDSWRKNLVDAEKKIEGFDPD